jgi:hypothetical protein
VEVEDRNAAGNESTEKFLFIFNQPLGSAPNTYGPTREIFGNKSIEVMYERNKII